MSSRTEVSKPRSDRNYRRPPHPNSLYINGDKKFGNKAQSSFVQARISPRFRGGLGDALIGNQENRNPVSQSRCTERIAKLGGGFEPFVLLRALPGSRARKF